MNAGILSREFRTTVSSSFSFSCSTAFYIRYYLHDTQSSGTRVGGGTFGMLLQAPFNARSIPMVILFVRVDKLTVNNEKKQLLQGDS